MARWPWVALGRLWRGERRPTAHANVSRKRNVLKIMHEHSDSYSKIVRHPGSAGQKALNWESLYAAAQYSANERLMMRSRGGGIGFAAGYTVVKDYVRLARTRSREVFVPLAHPPGHAQVDFGECVAVIGGARMKLHVFCFDLPHSDACFIKAYAAETTEAFLDGHVSAFAFFGGVPLADNCSLFLSDSIRQVR